MPEDIYRVRYRKKGRHYGPAFGDHGWITAYSGPKATLAAMHARQIGTRYVVVTETIRGEKASAA